MANIRLYSWIMQTATEAIMSLLAHDQWLVEINTTGRLQQFAML